MMRDDLVSLVQQMIDRGILFDDAQREFERTFITRALAKTNYNVCKAAKMTGLHRNTRQPEDDGLQDQEDGLSGRVPGSGPRSASGSRTSPANPDLDPDPEPALTPSVPPHN